jgi:hypothetical protein
MVTTVEPVVEPTGEGGPLPRSAPASGPGETVERPEPGLARGRFEAPAWFFYVIMVVTILGTVAWALAARARRRRRHS